MIEEKELVSRLHAQCLQSAVVVKTAVKPLPFDGSIALKPKGTCWQTQIKPGLLSIIEVYTSKFLAGFFVDSFNLKLWSDGAVV